MGKLTIYEKAKKQRTAYLRQNQIANYEFITGIKNEILSLGRRLKEIHKHPLCVYEDDIYYEFDRLRLLVDKQKINYLPADSSMIPGRHKDVNPNAKWRREIAQLRDNVAEDVAYLEASLLNPLIDRKT